MAYVESTLSAEKSATTTRSMNGDPTILGGITPEMDTPSLESAKKAILKQQPRWFLSKNYKSMYYPIQLWGD